MISSNWFDPCACATIPTVPIRRKPNPQNNREKSIALIATAPMLAGFGSCPTIAVSTTPISGVDKLDSMIGKAIDRTVLLRVSSELVFLEDD